MSNKNIVLDENKVKDFIESSLDKIVSEEEKESIKKTSEISVICATSGALIGSAIPIVGTAFGALLGASTGSIIMIGKEIKNRNTK